MYNPTERAVSRILFRMTSLLSSMVNFHSYLHNCLPTSEPSQALRLLTEVTSDSLSLMMEVVSELQYATRNYNSTSASIVLQSLREQLLGWRADLEVQRQAKYGNHPRVKQ